MGSRNCSRVVRLPLVGVCYSCPYFDVSAWNGSFNCLDVAKWLVRQALFWGRLHCIRMGVFVYQCLLFGSCVRSNLLRNRYVWNLGWWFVFVYCGWSISSWRSSRHRIPRGADTVRFRRWVRKQSRSEFLARRLFYGRCLNGTCLFDRNSWAINNAWNYCLTLML